MTFHTPWMTVNALIAGSLMSGGWLVAQAPNVPDFVKGGGEFVGIAALAWFLWYTTSRVMPRQIRESHNHVEKIIAANQEASKRSQDVFADSVKVLTASHERLGDRIENGHAKIHARIDEHLRAR